MKPFAEWSGNVLSGFRQHKTLLPKMRHYAPTLSIAIYELNAAFS
jgi:hypothetical protein